MSEEYIELNYKAVAEANSVCEPLLKARNDLRIALDECQEEYDGVWRDAYKTALKAQRENDGG